MRLGFGKVGQSVRTNGTSTTLLRNYERNTTGLAVGLQLGYSHAWGKLRLHADARYTIIALGQLRYDRTDGTGQGILFHVLDQEIAGGLAVGGFFNAAGGIDLRLRLGIDAWINQMDETPPPLALSNDIILGMNIGVEFAMPAVFYIVDRPFGFRIKGGALAPATRVQQPNNKTAPDNTTLGGYVGASIFAGTLLPSKKGQLHIEMSYDFSFAFSHFTGQCPPTTSVDARVCRDDSVDDARYSSSAHIGTIGLYYQY